MKRKRIHCCEITMLCVFSLTGFSRRFSFAAWVDAGESCNPCSIIFSLPSATSSLSTLLCELVSGVSCFWEGKGGVGNSRKESPYFTQKTVAVWLHELCGRSMKHLMETLYQLRRCTGVNNNRKGSRFGLIENEGFGLE